MEKNSRRRVRIVDRSDDEDHRAVEEMTPGERLSIMWQLTLDARAFEDGGRHAESRLP